MGMLNHNEQSTAKGKLNRGTKIVVENQVKREDVVDMESTKITFPVNVRVDNHIRNQISSLLNLGIAKSQKNLVKQLVENEIDSLSDSDRNRFEKMFNILEEKDNLKSK